NHLIHTRPFRKKIPPSGNQISWTAPRISFPSIRGRKPMPAVNRRSFLQTSGAACGVALGSSLRALAEPPERNAASGAKERKFNLGTVTYNIAKDWDLPTLLDVCKKTGLAACELRTTHKHGVEPTLTPDQRTDVKKRFADSGIVFWGCGSVCEFHA